MRYMVVLDVRSPLGRIYADGNHDALVAEGELKHPILDCVEVEPDRPNYLFVVREKRDNKARQTQYIPHAYVLSIHRYAEKDPPPFGFTS